MNPDKRFCRPYAIFFTKNDSGVIIEIGNVEIEPKKAAKCLVDIDRTKMLEVAKRQLHLRPKTAKSPEELYTFAMLVHGNKFELYVVYFKDGFCGYNNISKFDFPCQNSISLIDNTLDLLPSFFAFKILPVLMSAKINLDNYTVHPPLNFEVSDFFKEIGATKWNFQKFSACILAKGFKVTKIN